MFTLIVVCFIAFIEPGGQNALKSKKTMPSKQIEKVLAVHTDSLMAMKGVVGVGIGELNGKPCIKVMVDKITRKLRKQIPKSLDGFPVVVEETGEFKARSKIQQY